MSKEQTGPTGLALEEVVAPAQKPNTHTARDKGPLSLYFLPVSKLLDSWESQLLPGHFTRRAPGVSASNLPSHLPPSRLPPQTGTRAAGTAAPERRQSLLSAGESWKEQKPSQRRGLGMPSKRCTNGAGPGGGGGKCCACLPPTITSKQQRSYRMPTLDSQPKTSWTSLL